MINTALKAVPDLRLLRAHPGTELVLATIEGGVVELAASSATGLPGVRIEVDLADAVGHWHPGQRSVRTLPPDSVRPSETSLVQSAPVGAALRRSGGGLVRMGSQRGVGELVSVVAASLRKHKTFVVDVQPVRPLFSELILLLAGPPLADGVRRLAHGSRPNVPVRYLHRHR